MSQCQRCGAEIPRSETKLFVGNIDGTDFAFSSVECPVELIATVCPACSAPVHCGSNLNRECTAGLGSVPLTPGTFSWNSCSLRAADWEIPHPRQSLRERRRLTAR